MTSRRSQRSGTRPVTLCRPTAQSRDGFALVELLAVIAIVTGFAGLLLPALLRVREAGRKAACGNNVRQAGLAVLSYELHRQRLPAGYDQIPAEPDLPDGTLHAWSSFVLPFIEEGSLAARIDYARSWNAPGGNEAASRLAVASYVCPSSQFRHPGKADYGGISGAWIVELPAGRPPADGLTNGLLIPVSKPADLVRSGEVTDGMSHTLLIGESIDRGPTSDESPDENDPYGRWAVYNCFAQTEATINTFKSDIRGLHPGGAMVAFGDARVVFLDEFTDAVVLSAICSRNGGEAATVGWQ